MHREIFKKEINKSKKLNNTIKYLILIEKNGILAEIIPACTESKVLEITRNEKNTVTVFGKARTANAWRFLCCMEAM
uniref:Uncharacterized protein n=1 Tax=Dulem virus 211 TaxID=3145688 RepID=A0AAU8AXA3_9VIRU